MKIRVEFPGDGYGGGGDGGHGGNSFDLAELRDDMRKEFGAVRQEMGELSKAVTHGDLVTRVWMLLLCGAMLGVMARGFHWA